jgi:hypothetical protein
MPRRHLIAATAIALAISSAAEPKSRPAGEPSAAACQVALTVIQQTIAERSWPGRRWTFRDERGVPFDDTPPAGFEDIGVLTPPAGQSVAACPKVQAWFQAHGIALIGGPSRDKATLEMSVPVVSQDGQRAVLYRGVEIPLAGNGDTIYLRRSATGWSIVAHSALGWAS